MLRRFPLALTITTALLIGAAGCSSGSGDDTDVADRTDVTAAATPTATDATSDATTEVTTGDVSGPKVQIDPPSEARPGPDRPADMAAAAEEAGVPVLDAEAFVTHTHTRLVVIVDGVDVVVPAGIGIDEGSDTSEHKGSIAALHTHDVDGVLHVESPNPDDTYTLAQALTMWGVPTDDAGLCEAMAAAAGCTVEVFDGDITDVESFEDIPFHASDLDDDLLDNHLIVLRLTSP